MTGSWRAPPGGRNLDHHLITKCGGSTGCRRGRGPGPGGRPRHRHDVEPADGCRRLALLMPPDSSRARLHVRTSRRRTGRRRPSHGRRHPRRRCHGSCLPLRPRQRARVQEVVATLLVNEHRCSVSASAGVFQPRFLPTSTSGISYTVGSFGSEDKAVLQDRQPRLIGAFAPIEARRRAPVPRLAPSRPRATLRKRDAFPPQPS